MNSLALILHSFQYNTNLVCNDNPTQDHIFTNLNCTYSSGTHRFLHFLWNNEGSKNQGLAIYFCGTSTSSSGTLEVEHCSFSHCHSSGDINSGGVVALCISSASVSHSLFYDCSCEYSDSQEGCGIFMGHLSRNPFVQSCSFISCISGDDGEGCGIWFCGSFVNYAVDSCRFTKCKGTYPESGQDGAIMYYNNSGTRACTDCIFSESEAYYGGSLYLYCSSYATNTPPAMFCFFNKNSVVSSWYGNDVAIEDCPLRNASVLFQCCVSTSNPNRIGYCYITWNWMNADVDWLP